MEKIMKLRAAIAAKELNLLHHTEKLIEAYQKPSPDFIISLWRWDRNHLLWQLRVMRERYRVLCVAGVVGGNVLPQ